MTPQEKKINQVEKRVDSLEAVFKSFMQEMRDFKTEMRQQNKMRAEEIMEMRQKHDADMKEIRTSIDGMGKHVQNLTVAAIVGIGAAVAGIGAIAVTVIYSVLTR